MKLHHAFVLENDVVLIMEYVSGGELYQYVKTRGGLAEPEARKVFHQLAYTVEYCHNKYVIHRDLKPTNILISDMDTLDIKLIDFGISGSNYGKDKSTAGSLAYMPPEVLTSANTAADPAIDVWALGVILYFMLFGQLPFAGLTEKEVKKRILSQKVDFGGKKEVTGECKKLIEGMLAKNPKERMKMMDILESEWMNMSEKKLSAPLPKLVEKPKPPLGGKTFSQSFKIPMKSSRPEAHKKLTPFKKPSFMRMTPRSTSKLEKHEIDDHKLLIAKCIEK